MVAGDVGARLEQSIWKHAEERPCVVRLPIATSMAQVRNGIVNGIKVCKGPSG